MGTLGGGPTLFALAFATAVALFACAIADPSPPRTAKDACASCHADRDCAVTTFSGCCACCPSEPHAMTTCERERATLECAAIECKACMSAIQAQLGEVPDPCPEVADPARFVARCRNGTCVATR